MSQCVTMPLKTLNEKVITTELRNMAKLHGKKEISN